MSKKFFPNNKNLNLSLGNHDNYHQDQADQLKSLQSNFNQIISQTKCGIVQISNDEAMTIIYMNDAFINLTGYTKDEISDLLNNSFKAFLYEGEINFYRLLLANQVRHNNSGFENEFRLKRKDKSFIWAADHGGYVQLEDGTEAYFAIIIDISTQKDAFSRLLDRNERDGLTKLYNRSCVNKLVDEFIANRHENDSAAFVVFDIDDFKTINDNFGHLFADTLLIDIAHEITHFVSDQDFSGRLGGDEFFMFIKNIDNQTDALNKVNAFLQRLEEISNLRVNSHQFTCSAGISLYPGDGNSFSKLYQKADTALYHAKYGGKNRSVIFNNSLVNNFNSPMIRKKSSKNIDNSEKVANDDFVLLDSIIDTLLKTSCEIAESINMVLRFLGKHYNLSRVYIFEDNPLDDSYIANTFEWCNEGVLPEIDNLQFLSKDVLEPFYRSLKNSNGIYYVQSISKIEKQLRDILEPQNVKAVLHHELSYNGHPFGFIGFDDCEMERYWDQSLVYIISRVSAIIALILYNYRLSQKYNLPTNNPDICYN